jgi:hypothetical protein
VAGSSGAGCVSVGGVTSRVGKASASTGNHDGAGLCRRELGSVWQLLKRGLGSLGVVAGCRDTVHSINMHTFQQKQMASVIYQHNSKW